MYHFLETRNLLPAKYTPPAVLYSFKFLRAVNYTDFVVSLQNVAKICLQSTNFIIIFSP